MHDRNKKSSLFRPIFIACLVLAAILFDLILGTSRFPILTIVVCGIVVIYECISPFVYSAR